MTATTKVPLGASTTNRKWYVDVDTTGSDNWVGVFGISDFQFTIEPDLVDDSDFDSDGYRSQTKTAEAWSLTFTVKRKATEADSTAYDTGQEFLRGKGIGQMGRSNRVHVRFYEMEPSGPREESYEGYAAVSWSPQGGDMAADSMVDVTLTGQGALDQPTHPDA